VSDSANSKAPEERRRHFRVMVQARVAVGPFSTPVQDDAFFALRERHADFVDSLLAVRREAEPVLVDAVDRSLDYFVHLLDLLAGQFDTRPYEDRELSVALEDREISLSEGGLGFDGEPPCGIGERLPVVLIASDHPAQRPLQVTLKLVRIQEAAERTILGFEFVDVDRSVRRHLVDLVFRAQRRKIRRERET
jgi:hypothetical protein